MKAITRKLLEFQKKVSTVKKDEKATLEFKAGNKTYNYATLANILGVVKPLLNELGLVLNQPILNNSVCTQITDPESGESVSGEIPLPTNLTPQQLGSAITYYRRYLLAGMLALEIEDDDGSEASNPDINIKPVLPNEKFETFIRLLIAGEPNIYERTEARYRFTKEQLEKINKIV